MAGWFYMPVLILAMMTAYALDQKEIQWRYGFRICAIFMAAFAAISLLPKKDEEGNVVWFSFPNYPEHFYLVLAVCAAFLVLAALLIRRRNAGKPFWKLTVLTTTCACLICTMVVVYFGAFTPQRARQYADEAIDPENDISISVSEDDFFRTDISENCDNYPMLWKLPCMRAFQSVVPVSIMDFYESIGVTRDVASRPDLSYYALRGLFSVKYYFDQVDVSNAITETPELDLPGFVYEETENGFRRFRNTAYIPMGFMIFSSPRTPCVLTI